MITLNLQGVYRETQAWWESTQGPNLRAPRDGRTREHPAETQKRRIPATVISGKIM